ncbi:sperm motility kinase X-like protein [Cricetulus griseus]|uniref:non-specific serine/threonine protein kinase n=1 Tax=Cricetulus griseus TaxID=10029 RepID=A0A061I1Q6_CRIGR|nr:sperm motility kinase X-like protein [Cricetulus griseus]
MEQGREACYSYEESFLTDYKMMMTVGHGHFSEVKLAFHVPTVTCVSVKVLRMKHASLVANEVSIMKSLQHPNIIKLFHVVQSRDTTYLVMEHASQGDLRHILELGSLQEKIFVEKAYDGCAVDIWSLGVLLFLMVVGLFTFQTISSEGVRCQIMAANFRIPEHVSIDIFNVIVEMLMINPDRRPTIDQIMRHPMTRDSKAHSQPMSTQKSPGTVSPGIVSTMTVMGSEEMSEDFSDSKVPSSGSLISSVHPSLLRYTASSRPDHNETTRETDNISSCSYQEELWSSMETAQNVTPRGSFSGDIFQVDTITQEEDINEEVNITQEEAMNEKDTITEERTITQEKAITEKVTITQEEDITKQATITQEVSVTKGVTITKEEAITHEPTIILEEDMAREVTMTLEDTRTKEVTMADGVSMTQTESITEKETVIKHEDIIQETTITLEVTMAQLATLTQESTITQEEAITHGQPEDAGPASSGKRRCPSWKRVKKIMVNCLRHLFCCLLSAKRRQDSCKTLAPKKRDLAVTHRTRWGKYPSLFILFLLSFVTEDGCALLWQPCELKNLSLQKEQSQRMPSSVTSGMLSYNWTAQMLIRAGRAGNGGMGKGSRDSMEDQWCA